jgi:predicted PurR-regulated permease PerM
VLTTLAVIAALYFAKAILVPLALAILLTFVLAPPVRFLRAWGLGRVPSVAIVVFCAFLVIFGIGSFIGQQLAQLAGKLPQYDYVIQHKIQELSSAASGGTLERFSGFLESLSKQIGKRDSNSTDSPPQKTSDGSDAPVPVEIHQPPPTPIDVLKRFFVPLLDPLATTGVVVVFVIFFLLERRDLRDRLIRLAGSYDLQRTTEAINDAAQRLSRYFIAQTALNGFFGLIVAIGLGLIGVPNPVLWGIIGMVLRFVPYIGAIISAAFPVTLAIAVDPGWSMALWTVALFLIVEPLIGQVIEPLVYGHSTGLSPVAVIVAASFWTWLWGAIGLLLSTPLTVCLAVLGRHVEWLQFLEILIADEAPLTPAQSFYQRALAGDTDDVSDQAEEFLKTHSLLAYYDEVALQALILAEIDLRRGALDDKQIFQINQAVRRLLDELAGYEDKLPQAATSEDGRSLSLAVQPSEEPRQPNLPGVKPSDIAPELAGEPIVCIAGRGPFDETATAMLVQVLEKHGLKAHLESNTAVSSLNVVRLKGTGVRMACLSLLDIGHTLAHLRYATRRVRAQLSQVQILACLWGHDRSAAATAALRASAGADLYAFSLTEAVSVVLATARSTGGAGGTAETAGPNAA